ncbi:MAG: hypothetical protein O7D30_10900, partial [Rickettsia endosymbiont of Ixodes persulcatus]|nr:hypothetical protein [Rickettsia endosymbiont of Ixodes persulcatus]
MVEKSRVRWNRSIVTPIFGGFHRHMTIHTLFLTLAVSYHPVSWPLIMFSNPVACSLFPLLVEISKSTSLFEIPFMVPATVSHYCKNHFPLASTRNPLP